jgi:hypothetical protein
VLTPAEQQLSRSAEGSELVKKMLAAVKKGRPTEG